MPRGVTRNGQQGQKIFGTDAKPLKAPYGAGGLKQNSQRPKKSGGVSASIASPAMPSYEPHSRMSVGPTQDMESTAPAISVQRQDVSQPYQEQRIHDAIPARVGPYKGVHVQPYNARQFGKSGFIGGLELAARKKMGNRGF